MGREKKREEGRRVGAKRLWGPTKRWTVNYCEKELLSNISDRKRRKRYPDEDWEAGAYAVYCSKRGRTKRVSVKKATSKRQHRERDKNLTQTSSFSIGKA
jgi:hypothetical protein